MSTAYESLRVRMALIVVALAASLAFGLPVTATAHSGCYVCDQSAGTATCVPAAPGQPGFASCVAMEDVCHVGDQCLVVEGGD